MKAKYLLLMAALALLVITWCNRRTGEEADRKTIGGTIEFIFTGDDVKFAATAQSITVDWGDGSTEEYHNLDSTAVVHRYAKEAEHTVRIRTEKLSAFDCVHDEYREGRITALDVSNCPTLTTLGCSNNGLSALDVSRCSALTGLWCGNNQLSAAALNQLFTALPDQSGMEWGGTSVIGSNPGSETCNSSIAAAKNWNF
jgi:hypothetical protein